MKNKSTKEDLREINNTSNVDPDVSYSIKTSKPIDVLMKVSAVLLAFILWFYAMAIDSPTSTRTISQVPVAIINEDKISLSILSGYDTTIDLVLQGKKSDLDKLTAENIEAYVDVEGINEADRYSLDIEVNVPSGINLLSKTSNTVTVYIDNTTTVSVPIEVKFKSFIISKEYVLGDPVTNINEVKITGPSAILEEINSAVAELELGNVTSSLRTVVPLVLVNSSGTVINNPYVKMNNSQVEVSVPLLATKTVPLTVTNKYGYFNDTNVKISIDPPSITLKGELKYLTGINSITIAQLDEKKITSDTLTQSIEIPENLTNVYGNETATITIKHIGTATKDIVIDDILVNNPNELSYELIDNFINLKIRGQETLLPFISADNIIATIDLGNITGSSGSLSVPVSITITGTTTSAIYEIGDYKATVNIK